MLSRDLTMNNLFRNPSTHSLNTISQRSLVLFSRPRPIAVREVESPHRVPYSSLNTYDLSHVQHIADVLPHEVVVQQLHHAIEQCQTVSALLEYAQQRLSEVPATFFQRIQQLHALAEVEDDMEMSLSSLRNALMFVCLLETFRLPSLTLNDVGLLQMNWRVARDHALTVRFDDEYQISYVIFRPSHFTTRRVILRGGMYILDFLEYLTELRLQLHQQHL